MAELGVEAPRFHEELGAVARALGIDVRRRRRRARAGATAGRVGGGRGRCGRAVVPRRAVEPGDVVLVKASRAVGLEVVAEALTAVAAQ